MNKQFEIIKAMATASNKGDQPALCKVILNSDFNNMPVAKDAAISAFNLTDENVINNMEAAKKIANFTDVNDFRAGFRQSLLIGMIDELNKATGQIN